VPQLVGVVHVVELHRVVAGRSYDFDFVLLATQVVDGDEALPIFVDRVGLHHLLHVRPFEINSLVTGFRPKVWRVSVPVLYSFSTSVGWIYLHVQAVLPCFCDFGFALIVADYIGACGFHEWISSLSTPFMASPDASHAIFSVLPTFGKWRYCSSENG